MSAILFTGVGGVGLASQHASQVCIQGGGEPASRRRGSASRGKGSTSRGSLHLSEFASRGEGSASGRGGLHLGGEGLSNQPGCRPPHQNWESGCTYPTGMLSYNPLFSHVLCLLFLTQSRIFQNFQEKWMMLQETEGCNIFSLITFK